MSNRIGTYKRETKETSIEVSWDLDGTGTSDVSTGIGFLDHMIDQLARHGIFDITLKAHGDLHIDTHHTVEDAGIALGRALLEALGDARGIVRMGDALVPLDESLAQVSVDLSGRAYSVIDVTWTDTRIGELPCDLYEHFLQSLAHEGRFNLHARILAGVNDHHKAESLMKALARSLSAASRLDPRRAGQTPSTKGVLGVAASDPKGDLLHALLDQQGRILEYLALKNYVWDYKALQSGLHTTNVAQDEEYQRSFRSYYQVRRAAGWCEHYFDILEREKENRNLEFSDVLEELQQRVQQVEASFASKLVATVRPEKPVYDRKVKQRLELHSPDVASSPRQKLNGFVQTYAQLEARMQGLLSDPRFRSLNQAFDAKFPNAFLSDMKKLDLLIWTL